MPRSKRYLFGASVLLILGATFEVGARVVYYVTQGFNPFYLTFGFAENTEVSAHSQRLDGYTKFVPNLPKRRKLESGEIVEMQVNADGFRGAKDFVRPKPPGTFRVVTLGESSTFGFSNLDHETYPVYLEDLLGRVSPGRPVEVYNLGIPHLTSVNQVALARAELPSLAPDLITIYAGCNDAIYPEDRSEMGLLFNVKNWLYWRSMGWRTIHESVKRVYHAYVTATNSDPVGVKNMDTPLVLSRERVELMRDEAVRRYRENLRTIIELGHELGARTLLVKQALTLHYYADGGLEGPWMPYADELRVVQENLERDGALPARQAFLLIHAGLMQALDALAAETGALLADGIRILDQDRPQMVSYVHLSAQGNRMLAAEMAAAVQRAGLLGEAHEAEAGPPAVP